jgi:hypothetical protein
LSQICDIILDNAQTGQIAWHPEIADYETSVVFCFVHIYVSQWKLFSSDG